MDEGVCIRQWDWSETSQTVTLLCAKHGLLRCLAKGSKRSTHPYSGGIELLTRGRLGVIVRPSSELALLTEWDLQETFPPLRRSLAAHHAGMYLAELVQHAVHDHDPHERLYMELLGALRSLEIDDDRSAMLVRFQWALLVETGYRPVLDRDVATGGPLGDGPWCFFDPVLGGLVNAPPTTPPTGRHEEQGAPPTAAAGRGWRVRRATIDALRTVAVQFSNDQATSGMDSSQAARGAEKDHERAARLLASYLRYVLGREPRLLNVLFGTKLPR